MKSAKTKVRASVWFRQTARYLRSKFALQLWCSMMALILIGTGLLWILHLRFFEPNYIDATANRIENTVRPYIDEEALRPENVEMTLTRLSMLISGTVLLGDAQGRILHTYSIGFRGVPDVPDVPRNIKMIDARTDPIMGEGFRKVLAGRNARIVLTEFSPKLILMIGQPIRYEGNPAALFLVTAVSEIHTLQELNRSQLLFWTLSLMAAVSLIALLFIRYFAKPIEAIRTTVNRLAEGDLSAVSDVRRDDELGQLAKSVEALGGALRRLDVLRKEVIANVSHELRTPLSLIIGYAEMVRDISWKDDASRDDHLNLIIAEAGRLGRIVDDILDYSQLQAGFFRLNLTECNLFTIVADEVEFCRKIARQFDIRVSLEAFSEDIPVLLDPIKMIHVLRNLTNNAVNHTKDGEEIRVLIENERGTGIRVSVVNPGPEIPEEMREVIWERYQRVQHHGSRQEGSGIGLSIVSKILSVHGFAYGVDATEDRNTFWFLIPSET